MGEVYRARDTRLDRMVALKVLPGHLSGNEELPALRPGGEGDFRPLAPLFAVRPKSTPDRQFTASKDGQRFLVNVSSSGQQSPPITLVQDWATALAP